MSATTLPRPVLADPASRLRGLVRGREEDAAWVRPALIALLLGTLITYTIDLTQSGYANSFYAAAVQAGTKSWKAFLFGSIDSSNFITVDKPPASLWVMALSGRIFGFSSFSMLMPQVLEGVIAVGLLYAAVKRWFGAGAGVLAGALLAVTPVAALMFRFNNPDALLVCLMVAAAYCLVRAVENGSTRWIVGVGTLLGFAFLAKMLQAFLVLPGFALVYVVAAPGTVSRRMTGLAAGGAALILSAGWWVALDALWPAASRPYVDGSQSNSIINLILGYNGLGRLFGSSGPGGGGGGANFSGATGILRLFNSEMGAQASWLLPAAVLALVAGLWTSRRARRGDHTRAAMLLWGSWLVVSAAVFSLGSGVIHTYYTVALAPAICALVAIGAVAAWRERDRIHGSALLIAGIVLSAGWSWVLLDRNPSWNPWLRVVIPLAAGAAGAGLLAAPRMRGRLAAATAAAGLAACLLGPVAYTVQTIGTAHTGSTPMAGPSTDTGGPGGHGGGGGGMTYSVNSTLVRTLESGSLGYRWTAAVSGSESAAALELASGGDPVMAIGGFNGQGGDLTLAQFKAYVAKGLIHYYIADSGGAVGAGGRGMGEMTATASKTPTAQSGSAAGGPPSGGMSGSMPSRSGTMGGPGSGSMGAPGGSTMSGRGGGAMGGPGGGAMGGPGGGSSTQAITTWVKAHFKSVTVGGTTLYDLSQAKS